MTVRKAALAALVIVVATGAFSPALAAKRKPHKKTYEMTLLPVPLPAQGTPSCNTPEAEGIGQHTETLKVAASGVLEVKIEKFTGDWDITLFDAKTGATLMTGGPTVTGGGAPEQNATEKLKYKNKKGAKTFRIVSCNFAGTHQATGSYVYTYNK